MTETTATPAAATYRITAQDIKKLRTCDQIVFRYSRETAAYGRAGLSQVEAYKEADATNPWEQRHVIPAASSCSTHEDGYRVGRAFALLYRYKGSHSPLHTVLALLKPGDVLTLVWTAANDNDHLRRAGLHHDSLALGVLRGKTQMLFHLATAIGPSDTARMCSCEPGSAWDRD